MKNDVLFYLYSENVRNMKRINIYKYVAGLLLAITMGNSMATIVVIDYEGVPGDPGSSSAGLNYFPPGSNSWDEDGFRTAGDYFGDPSSILFGGSGSDAYSQANDSVAVRVNNGASTLNVFQINGDAFGAFAIDLSENCLTCGVTHGVITGTKFGGGTVSMAYTLDDILGSETFDLFGFSSEFGNITNLSWARTGPSPELRTQLDNINLSTSAVSAKAQIPVPVPPTVWLFGSGLIGLACAARRKKS
jgi:hypothetical protein